MIEVLKPGLQLTIQDGGRRGTTHWGVASGGAMDMRSYQEGNYLLKNLGGEAAFEITRGGVDLRFHVDTWIALTGADAIIRLDNELIEMGKPMRASSGSQLSIGSCQNGERMYLCVAGGLEVPVVLGSRALNISGKFGGGVGRPLIAGDRIACGIGDFDGSESRGVVNADWRDRTRLKVIAGPEANWFEGQLSGRYRVGIGNRNGIRLEGSALTRVPEFDGCELRSRGVICGTIQIFPDGTLVILSVDQDTTGGFPVAGYVVFDDLWKLGQLAPRDAVTFQFVLPELK